jgi:hypothetical protein
VAQPTARAVMHISASIRTICKYADAKCMPVLANRSARSGAAAGWMDGLDIRKYCNVEGATTLYLSLFGCLEIRSST